MRIVTDLENPWNDDKPHYSIPIHRYGDTFFVRERTPENTGMEFPERLDGATFGQLDILMKDEHAVQVVIIRLEAVVESLRDTLATKERERLFNERSKDGEQV